MRHFGHFSLIFAQLSVYRKTLMAEAAALGWPLIRQMAAHYSYDDMTWSCTSQYLFGKDFLVAPVLSPAALTQPLSFQDLHVTSFAAWTAFNGGYRGGRTTSQVTPLPLLPHIYPVYLYISRKIIPHVFLHCITSIPYFALFRFICFYEPPVIHLLYSLF